MNYTRCKVIACATVIEEMQPVMPPGLKHEVLEFGLHVHPEKLKEALQKAIDSADTDVDTILLGYGLCSQAVTGLSSSQCTLVIPRVDDCIALFMGSISEYDQQHKNAPGTLYMTKGWIEADNPLDLQASMIERYGEAKARSLFKQLFRNYTRLVFINTGNYELELYRTKSKKMAEALKLQFEEIKGSNSIITRLLMGPWDSDFIVIPPGGKISFSDFRKS
jgi:hypothetical protein